MRSPSASSRRWPAGTGSVGSGSPAGLTYVPFADCRSSTHQRWPSVLSWQCRRETPVSAPQSPCGWMPRDTDGRPTSTLRSRRTTRPGSPADGIGSSGCCAAYQSGSIQISATHWSGPGTGGVGRWVPDVAGSPASPPVVPAGAWPGSGGGVAADAGDGPGSPGAGVPGDGAGALDDGGGVGADGGSSDSADGGSTGSGSAPVVKSYPQFSQNSAPGGAANPQCGHCAGSAAGEAADAAGDGAPAGAAAGVDAAPMGSPHTSQ